MTTTADTATARALLDQAASAPTGYPDGCLPRGEQVTLATAYALLAVAEELAAIREAIAVGVDDVRDAVKDHTAEVTAALDDTAGYSVKALDNIGDAIQGLIDDNAIARMSWWGRRRLRRHAEIVFADDAAHHDGSDTP